MSGAPYIDRTSSNWNYDPSVQMGYLKFTDAPIRQTITQDYVNVDLDEFDRVVGIEVFL